MWKQLIGVFGFIVIASGAALNTAQADDDPPARVARLNYVQGEVNFSPAGDDEWVSASLNRPFTTGDRLWVARDSRAELHIGSSALRADAQSSFDFLTLDDDDIQVRLSQGTLNVHVRSLWSGQSVEIDTPNLAFVVRNAASFTINVNPDDDTTTIAVDEGEGVAVGDERSSYEVRRGRTLQFRGNNLQETGAPSFAISERFAGWVRERDAREERSSSSRYVSREVTGYEDLDEHGSWRDVSGYGHVWVPRVTVVDWAPYRYGHWAWVAPWGWTWIDDAPWGFAPFHYGRWIYADLHWCWVPGVYASRPVYSPALVVFAGGYAGTSWSLSIGPGIAGVAWFPLAPGEAWYPTYRYSPRYLSNVNYRIALYHDDPGRRVYAYQRRHEAITAIASDRFVAGAAVRDNRREINPDVIVRTHSGNTPVITPFGRQSVFAGRERREVPQDRAEPRAVLMTREPRVAPALRDRYLRSDTAENRPESDPRTARELTGSTRTPGAATAAENRLARGQERNEAVSTRSDGSRLIPFQNNGNRDDLRADKKEGPSIVARRDGQRDPASTDLHSNDGDSARPARPGKEGARDRPSLRPRVEDENRPASNDDASSRPQDQRHDFLRRDRDHDALPVQRERQERDVMPSLPRQPELFPRDTNRNGDTREQRSERQNERQNERFNPPPMPQVPPVPPHNEDRGRDSQRQPERQEREHRR